MNPTSLIILLLALVAIGHCAPLDEELSERDAVSSQTTIGDGGNDLADLKPGDWKAVLQYLEDHPGALIDNENNIHITINVTYGHDHETTTEASPTETTIEASVADGEPEPEAQPSERDAVSSATTIGDGGKALADLKPVDWKAVLQYLEDHPNALIDNENNIHVAINVEYGHRDETTTEAGPTETTIEASMADGEPEPEAQPAVLVV